VKLIDARDLGLVYLCQAQVKRDWNEYAGMRCRGWCSIKFQMAAWKGRTGWVATGSR